jgi:thiol-disulfide isomerase/thioredoxin
MKNPLHVLLVLVFALLSTSIIAQLPNGSVAPDWTLTDLNGDTYNLYDELNDGKSIVLDISATWCPPCWTYHTSGVLEALYDDYGPDGTDQIRVFMVEADDATNLACLYGSAGCNNTTMGDWVTGTNYPIFSPEPAAANDFISDYQLAFWPTIYGISPLDKTTQLIGQATYSTWEGWLIDSWQMSASSSSVDSDCPYEGMVDLEMVNGYGDLQFEWSNGDSEEDLIDVPAGTYSVTITDDHNVDIVLDNIVVGGTDAPALAVTDVESEDVDCNGNNTGSLQVLASGGQGGFAYNWNNGLSGSYIDNLSQGDYEVTCTDINGCTVMQTYTIGEPDVLTMGVSAISTSCGNENGFASLFGDGGTTPYFYDIGFGGQFSGSFPSLAAGDYNSMITDGNGCITEQAITIEPSVAPVAVAEAAMPISCNDEEVTVTSENSTYVGDVDYIWNTDDGVIVGDDASETIMVSSAGTYTLKIIEIFTGCISETTVEVEDISLLPSISIASVEEINCDITQITIDGSDSEDGNNLVYEWTTTNGNIIGDVDGDIIDVDLEGTYTLSISNSVNGCVSTQSITVEADIEVPVIDVSNNVLTCSAIDVDICATVTAGHSVVWTTETGDISQICITVNAAGDYMATVSAPNGCTNSAVSVVTASTDLPVVSVANPNVLTCTQETVQVSVVVENASADDIITWTDADGNLIAEGSSDVLISTPGTYEVSVTNNLGCTTITSVTVEEDINSPVATFEYSVNNDGLVTLNSTSDESGSVTWTLADGTVLTGGDAEFSVSISGEYEVCMTYVNECGADENCQTVVYSTLLAVSIDKTDLTCYLSADGNISAMVSGGAQGYTYYWIGPDGFESTEPTISNLSAGIYNLLVGDQDGTEINSEVTITQPDVLMISSVIVVEEESGLSNGSIDISVIGGTGDFTYQWSNGGTTAKIENLAAGEYSVIITDANGCTYSENEIIVGTITDVTDLAVVEDFFMYPVPAYDFINVKTMFNGTQAVNVKILDATGRVKWTRSYSATQIEETIDLTSFHSGIYTLSMICGKSIQSENFIIIK